MLVASALGDLGIERPMIHINGGGEEERIIKRIQLRAESTAAAKAEADRQASLTDEQRAAEEAAKALRAAELQAQMDEWAAWKKEYAVTAVPNYTVAPPGPLTERGKVLQRVILARDYDTLFRLIPRSHWDKRWHFGKYSFVTEGGRRKYIPFTEGDIRRWVFSPYLNVAPGWDCNATRRAAIVAAHLKKSLEHKAAYPDTDWRHIWPLYPNGAYPGQHYNCQEYQGSTWVRIRSKVYIAVAIVVAVYLGPIILDKVGGFLAGGAEGAGAGAAAGAEGAVTATKTSAFISKVQKGVKIYNKLNSINSIIKGEVPPPPIGITGSTFKAVAMNAVKDYVAKEAKEYAIEKGVEYVAKKYTAKEEAKIAAEIQKIQDEIEKLKLVPPDTPIEPSPELAEPIRKKIVEIQNIERERESDASGLAVLALAIPAVLFLAG